MDVTGFALSVIDEARTLVTSVKDRIDSFKKGPETFSSLKDLVDSLAKHIEEVEKVLQKFPRAVPADVSVVFNETFTDVRNSLVISNSIMEKSFSKAFSATSSTAMDKVRSVVLRMCSAKSLEVEMNTVESHIREASSKLLQLALALGGALKLQEHQDELFPRMENLRVIQPTEGVYRSGANAPALTDVINLDFDSTDNDGKPTTLEGTLKYSVLSSDSCRTVTAATGVMRPAYGIVGMAGVGKTVALQGLAHDKDIQKRFRDGVHFMTLGQGATTEAAIRGIARIMAMTGAISLVESVRNSTSLQEAVDYAAPWFEARACLFLVDDIWPTQSCTTGFLADLRQLLRRSPESRMAVTTRSVAVAQYAGSVVNFGPRDTFGPMSKNIFMLHATGGASRATSFGLDQTKRKSVLSILSICAGLPIALAITGCTVALLTRTYGNFESACDAYAIRLEKKKENLGDADTFDGTSLNAGIQLSLEHLEVEYVKWQANCSHCCDYSITDLYTGLCVFENQTWVSVSVLSRLWNIDEDAALDIANLFGGMSLATLEVRRPTDGSSEQAGIVLHALLLDFCRGRAEKSKNEAQWHAQILNGYLETSSKPASSPPGQLPTQANLGWTSRPWWSDAVSQDGYIHANLARHLLHSGQGEELAALLLEARWTDLRANIGGILGLESDFDVLDAFFTHRMRKKECDNSLSETQRGFRQIFKAVLPSWGTLMMEGRRNFQFRLCGLLQSLRKTNAIVDAYLMSIESCTQKPYLLPVSTFFPDLSSAPKMEVPIGSDCECIDCSPCGNYVAAGTENDIVIAEIRTGEILQRLRGHTQVVWCVQFAQGSEKIVSGSRDRRIMVWEWQSSHSPVQILEGHDRDVTSVVVSRDGERIFSSSTEGPLRIWDVANGAKIGDISQNQCVASIALSADEQKIALGLYNATLQVLDIDSKEVVFEDCKAHELSIGCLCFSPNGKHLATGSADWTVKIWDAQKWCRVYRLEGHVENVTGIAFSPDSKKIASTSWDGTVRLWEIESMLCIGLTPAISLWITCVVFSSHEGRVICGSSDGVFRIWDELPSISFKESIEGHANCVLGVSISQDGLRVATASVDQTARLWDLQTGEPIGNPLQGHRGKVICVSFSPDGRKLVSGSDDWTLRLWDTQTYCQIGHPFNGHTSHVHCVSFSADGLRIVSGSSDRTVRSWNALTHEQMGDVMKGHERAVTGASESSDGCYIVSREHWWDNTIIWRRSTKAIVWKSELYVRDDRNSVSDNAAITIIRTCGQEIPRLWPSCFERYTAKVYWEKGSVYSNILGTDNVLGKLLPYADWKYNEKGNVFAAGLGSGQVAICKLIE